MAKKGQKFSKYSNNLKEEVVGELAKGKSMDKILRK